MTTNQISYWQLQESKRSNLAKEKETERSNRAQEGLEGRKVQETQRHNLVTESETERSNRVQEGIKRDTLTETTRSNKANESIKRDTLAETKRSNVVREIETSRANRAQEAETHRANLAKESETNRHNVVTEVEANKQNARMYDLQKEANALKERSVASEEALNKARILQTQYQNDLIVAQTWGEEAKADEIKSKIKVNEAQIAKLEREKVETDRKIDKLWAETQLTWKKATGQDIANQIANDTSWAKTWKEFPSIFELFKVDGLNLF